MSRTAIQKYEDYKLSWEFINQNIAETVSQSIGHTVQCHAVWDAIDYWNIVFDGGRLRPDELDLLCERLGATAEEKETSLPEEPVQTIGSLGMELSERLLQGCIGRQWKHVITEPDGLWLVGCHAGDILKVVDTGIWLGQLSPKEELLAYLEKNGASCLALGDFSSSYRKRYQKDLYWLYPVGSTRYPGMALVLVKEGILALPYEAVNQDESEIFDLESAHIIETAKEMGRLITEWADFTGELQEAMNSMYRYLQDRENGNE